ncbi:MAG: DinB family protein [Pirellulales bacterium]|nr:DinB family protein [Pirellulales bacterium]
MFSESGWWADPFALRSGHLAVDGGFRPNPFAAVSSTPDRPRFLNSQPMMPTASRRPEAAEFTSPYHRSLVQPLQGDCVLKVLDAQSFWLCELASHLSTEQIDKIHAPYQWTIRQVFEHCADAERVFGYRILRFAAGDQTALPGWKENAYADSRFGLGNFGHLVAELGALRSANLFLLRRIIPEAWDRQGEADGQRVSVRAIAWITAGHLHHHLSIVQQRCQLQIPREPNSDMASSH